MEAGEVVGREVGRVGRDGEMVGRVAGRGGVTEPKGCDIVT